MTLQSDAMPESRVEERAVPTTDVSGIQRLYWSIRRELWETRSIYIAPLGAAGVFLFGFLVSIGHRLEKIRAAGTLDAVHRRDAIAGPYDAVAGLLMLTAIIVGLFYCLDSLHSERRDRSILFWKSLPVSDLTTVLTKASIPLAILPVLVFTITVVTQLIMLIVSSVAVAASGGGVAELWQELAFPRMSLLLFYHLLTVHTLWAAPAYGWLIMVSAWARRAPFIWAFVPPVALSYLEKIVFGTTHFGNWLVSRSLAGNGMEAVMSPGSMPMDPITLLTPGRFLASPGFLLGLACTALFLGAAVRLRRYREPN